MSQGTDRFVMTMNLILAEERWLGPPAGAACRHITRGQRRGHQHRDHARKVPGSIGSIPVTRRSNTCIAANAPATPTSTPVPIIPRALSQNQTDDIARTSPHRHAHTDFRHALAGQVSQHSVDSDTGQQQREAREYAEKQQQEALPGQRISSELLHRMHLVERLIAGRSAHFPPQRLHHIQRRDAGADGNAT